jgi:hypothetical protein
MAMFAPMSNSLFVLFAQFGEPVRETVSVWQKLLLFVGVATVGALVAYAVSRGRVRFSLRGLLVCLTVVALLLGVGAVVARWEPAGKRNALRVARQWVIDQGRNPSTYKFFVDANEDGWQVFVEYQPPIPDAFTTLRMDSKGNITEVIGAP